MPKNRKTNVELQEEIAAMKTRLVSERVKLARFRLLVSDIPIERYDQAEYRETVDSLYQSLNYEENLV